MALLQEIKFEFRSQVLEEDTFAVVRFKGTEGLSRYYEFEIDLVSQEPEIDMTEVLKNPATFTILRDDGNIPFHGILTDFEQLHEIDGYVFYRAVLVPKLWWLSLTYHNQVLLNKSVPHMIEGVLKDGGLTSLDVEFKLEKEYPEWDYICQYGESHLNFVSRWMEREGIYYYFEQGDSSEKVIVTDEKASHGEMNEGATMYYSPPSALGESHREEIINAFICRQTMLPKTLRLRDYNYETPSMEITGSAEVSPNGRGEIYIYGEHFRTPKEGNALAKIRAEEYLCRERRFHGESTIPYIRPGYLFDLEDHYRSDVNRKYLTVEIEHEGNQAAYLIAGIRKDLHDADRKPYYRNSFVAIHSDVQFRPPLKTPKPRFYGTLNARIDSAGTGKYAELDDQGRYKVKLPFDESGRTNGKASAFFRMAQPYAGTDHGMHFPLHKGTEVLLTFTDGDPDRPIIAAAVPNPETPSQVTSADQSMSKITTAGGNKIHIEDQEGKERILMHTPNQNTWMRMGAPNDPPAAAYYPGYPPSPDEGMAIYTAGKWLLQCDGDWEVKTNQNAKEFTTGRFEKATIGITHEQYVGVKTDVMVGGAVELNCAYKKEFKPIHDAFAAVKKKICGETTKLSAQETKMQGEITKMQGELTKLRGDVTKLDGEVTKLEGEKTALSGEVTKLNGSVTKLEGEKTALAGEVTKLTGEVTKLNGSVTKLEGENTTLRGEVTKLTGEALKLEGEATALSGESTELTGMKTII
ncbi:MAG: type VI secretion system tip protein VgrG [Deltaproteobacteria bacterium]|nr:type VI secretion system tip protein VgrG [Deltaproteobacteria bacterium]MBN2688151.1 type VI secretion system tip protein VgrG [Deltaproteobacteria bacterium]